MDPAGAGCTLVVYGVHWWHQCRPAVALAQATCRVDEALMRLNVPLGSDATSSASKLLSKQGRVGDW
jgi:hypothetical protein